MAKRRRGKWKAVPQITPFERRNSIEIAKLIEKGHHPLGVTVHSAEGSYSYTYKDVAHYFERNQIPFSQTVSLYKMVKGADGKYQRQLAG